MSPLTPSASAAVARALPFGVRFKPTSTAIPSNSSQPRKVLLTVRPFSPPLVLASGLPWMPPAPPQSASHRTSIPNPLPSLRSTPAIPPSAASTPPLARFSPPPKLYACTRQFTTYVRDAHERLLSALSEPRSEEHTSELQSRGHLVCRLLLEKKKKK